MTKVRKLKSANKLWVSRDEKYLVTANTRNTVYVYDLENLGAKPFFSTKTVSNVSNFALSPDAKLLVAKNTSGEIALIRMEDGEELFRNKMEGREGYRLVFSEDGKSVLDFDWDGRTMVLDVESGKHTVVDGPNIRGKNGYPYVTYMDYDRYSDRILKIVQRPDDFHDGAFMTSSAKPGEISYETIRLIKDGYIPGFVDGISLCKNRNYYYERFEGILVVTDKEFGELKRIPLPEEFKGVSKANVHIWASPCDRYLLYDYMGNAILYEAETMKPVKAFDNFNTWDFTMIREDSVFVIGTWEGAFIGEV